MKSAKLAYLLAVVVLLSLTVGGCRKGLDKTTQIPGSVTGPKDDLASPPRGEGQPDQGGVVPPPPTDPGPPVAIETIKGPGIGASNRDFSNTTEDREMFAGQTVYFDFDKSNVKPGDVPKLEEVARRMKAEFPDKLLRIEGHCDERGTEEYNRALGDRRALSAREKLVQLGMDPEIIQTVTYGEEKPVDMEHNEGAWAKNRRAELILLTPK